LNLEFLRCLERLEALEVLPHLEPLLNLELQYHLRNNFVKILKIQIHHHSNFQVEYILID
jgi:hypothetical protein